MGDTTEERIFNSESNELSLDRICELMPKVELHAHLNGCITDEILCNLKKGNISSEIPVEKPNSSTDCSSRLSLDDCWKAFARVHEAIRTPELLYAATCQVIRDFTLDNVVYLELRSTPKNVHEIQTKEIYVESVVKAIIDSKKDFKTLVQLLISVDRRNGEKEGMENVHLAQKWSRKHPDVVVGLDISGDPTQGSIEWIGPLILEAKRLGIPVSCHLSEVKPDDQNQKQIGNLVETLAFLKLRPNRVGHGQFLHPLTGGTEELWDEARKSGIPMETCISSNVISGVSPSLEEHFVQYLIQDRLNFVICTDDSAVFKTTLSKEYKILLKMTSISSETLRDICLKSIHYSFASNEDKGKIRAAMEDWWKNRM